MGAKVDFPRLIELVYGAAADMQAWPAALLAVADAVGAHAASLEIADPENRTRPFVVAPRTDPEWIQAYEDRWAATNFVRERGLEFPAGVVYRFEDLIHRSDFELTPIYNEFFEPQRLNFALFTNAAKERDAVAGVGFYRARRHGGGFGRDNERLLKALAPHLQRAVTLNVRLARVEMERDSAAEMLHRLSDGILLVDARSRILFANLAAEALLKEGTGLLVQDGRLAARASSDTALLRSLISGGTHAGPSGTLALVCRGGRRLSVMVLPLHIETSWLTLPPAAIVLVKDPAASEMPSPEQIQRLFDLTPAQAALAREILNGNGIKTAAQRLQISRSTARTHLLAVFQKTGTNRQAELVRLILRQSMSARERL